MVNETVTSVSEPLANYWDRFVDFAPQLIASLVVLLIGLIVASVISTIVKKVLSLLESEQHVTEFLNKWGLRIQVSQFIGKFAWWLVFLVFLSASVQILEVTALTDSINTLVMFLPALFVASVIAALTVLAARVVRELVVGALNGVGFRSSRPVGTASAVVLMVFGFTLALAQLGVDTTLLTANITLIIGGIVLTLALAFGLGGRETAAKIIEHVYEKSKKSKKA